MTISWRLGLAAVGLAIIAGLALAALFYFAQ